MNQENRFRMCQGSIRSKQKGPWAYLGTTPSGTRNPEFRAPTAFGNTKAKFIQAHEFHEFGGGVQPAALPDSSVRSSLKSQRGSSKKINWWIVLSGLSSWWWPNPMTRQSTPSTIPAHRLSQSLPVCEHYLLFLFILIDLGCFRPNFQGLSEGVCLIRRETSYNSKHGAEFCCEGIFLHSPPVSFDKFFSFCHQENEFLIEVHCG